MSIKVGDVVFIGFENGEHYLGDVVRCYEEIDLAIVEYETVEGKHTVKACMSDLIKYQAPKEEPKKKSFCEKMKDKFMRRSYD